MRTSFFRDPAAPSMSAGRSDAEQFVAAEDVQREVAVPLIVAVEESSELFPVQRVVGGVQIQHDLVRRALMGLKEDVHEEVQYRPAVHGDLLVAAVPSSPTGVSSRRLSVLLPARGLPWSCEPRPVLAEGVLLADEGSQERIVRRVVVVVEILVSSAKP